MTEVQTEKKQSNPFASLSFISEIDFFSPFGAHVESCSPDERPMLVQMRFKEILREAVSHPEAVMNNCGDAIVLILSTTGLPPQAIPMEYTTDEETLTLTFYQHKEPEDRSLHYNVLTGHFLVLSRELPMHWRITEDTHVPDLHEVPSFLELRRGL